MLKDWCGAGGWLWKIHYQFRAMDPVGATLTCWGQITDKYVRDGLGFVECDIGMRNQDDQETTPGTASSSCRCAGTAGALSICRTARKC